MKWKKKFWQVPAASVKVTHSDSWFSTKETLRCQWSWNSEDSLERLLKKKFEYLACWKWSIYAGGVFLSSSSSQFTYIESTGARKLCQIVFFFHNFFGNDETIFRIAFWKFNLNKIWAQKQPKWTHWCWNLFFLAFPWQHLLCISTNQVQTYWP